jgi:pimeloyl-ACP methyl ester carboxylesterase
MRRGFVELDHGQMFYREAGSGRPIVLVHQILRTSLDYRRVMERLSKRYRVIAVDLMGCGDSDPPPDRYTFEDHGAAVASAIAALGLEDVVIAGHHGGGNIAMEAAVREPARIAKVVMSGPGWIPDPATRAEYLAKARGLADPAYRPDGSHLLAIWKEGLETNWGLPRLPPDDPEIVTEFFLEQIKTGERRFQPYVSLFEYDAPERMPLLRKPTLVLYASNDVWMCRGERDIARIVPDIRLQEIEGPGEMPRLRPDAWSQAVGSFAAA